MFRGQTNYTETCDASFAASELEDAHCLVNRDLLDSVCENSWRTWLGLSTADVGTFSATEQAIYEGCTAITTKVRFLHMTPYPPRA